MLRCFVFILLLQVGPACTSAPTATQLDSDNPVRPNAPPPFGMEEFFKQVPQPGPARARLGRWLFYDVRLSADRTVSCATCHRPSHAFSEPSPVPTGIDGGRGTRKTPSIINLAARTVLPDFPDDRAHLFFWDAQRGSELFFFNGRCAMCHAGFNFSDGRFHNLGVGWDAVSQSFADEGRALVTGDARDRGAFKTPGLRDVSKRAPYMHDGSLATLRDVVEFYNRGGVANPRRSSRLRGPLRLSSSDVDALVAFLQALDGECHQDQPPRYFPR